MALNSEKIKCIYMALKSTFSPLIYHKNKRKQEQIGIIIPVITVLWAIVSQELLKKTQSSIEKKENLGAPYGAQKSSFLGDMSP